MIDNLPFRALSLPAILHMWVHPPSESYLQYIKDEMYQRKQVGYILQCGNYGQYQGGY